MNNSLATQLSRAACQCALHRRKPKAIENAYWDLAIHVLALGPVDVPNEKVPQRVLTQVSSGVRAS